MMTLKLPATAALCAVLGLSACNDPARLTADGTSKTGQGALFGGLLGAGIGALVADDSSKGALIGAAAGAIAGGAYGNHLDQQEAELRAQLANDGITITNTGDRLIVSLPQDITFGTDSFTVRPALRSDLTKVADNLLRYPDSSVQIIGHTDSDGEAAYNATLSERRAGAVADVLQSGGVTFDRLQTAGFGEAQPVASNLTEEGKAQNRRVEIVVIPRNS
jgi:outer membrane protein OmpA-like peptidoglycan-associated protein